MRRKYYLFRQILLLIILIFFSVKVEGQTLYSSFTSADRKNYAVTFNIQNTNTYPITISQVEVTTDPSSGSDSFSFWYRSTAVSGTSTLSSAGGWTQAVSGTISYSSNLATISVSPGVVIPPSGYYGLAVSSVIYLKTPRTQTSVTSTTIDGVTLYSGGSSSYAADPCCILQYSPRSFWGSVTFYTPTVSPSSPPTLIPTLSPTQIPSTATPTEVPTITPSCSPTLIPTRQPTERPTLNPTVLPTMVPTATPTGQPSGQPSRQPSGQPSAQPSAQPISHPTSQPSAQPVVGPTSHPTGQPSTCPTSQPTRRPTARPSSQPSSRPSMQPSTQPSSEPSGQPSSHPSSRPSSQPSGHPTAQPSNQPSARPTAQPVSAPSSRPSGQPSSRPSRQPSGQPSSKPSSQPSACPSEQPSGQPTSKPSCQPSSQPSTQPSAQPSAQPSVLPSSQPTSHPSNQPSSIPSSVPTSQPTSVPPSQPSDSPTAQPSTIPSTQPSSQPTSRPSSQPSASPSSQPTVAPSSQPTSVPSANPSSQPSSQPSSYPSGQPSCDPTAQPSSQPSSLPTSQPSTQPSGVPTGQPSDQPTGIPTGQPTAQPSGVPSDQPTGQPSTQPSGVPTGQPSDQPTGIPTGQPTAQPSGVPSGQPTGQPTVQPSSTPSSQPSSQPSGYPSMQPTVQPTAVPTSQPSAVPSAQPSGVPSQQPTVQPTRLPTAQPSRQPTSQPSSQPSSRPSNHPSGQPSSQPSTQPTVRPTGRPSSQPSYQPSSQPTSQPTRQPTSQPTVTPSVAPTTKSHMSESFVANYSKALESLTGGKDVSIITDSVRVVSERVNMTSNTPVQVQIPLTDTEKGLVASGQLVVPSVSLLPNANGTGNASVQVAVALVNKSAWNTSSNSSSGGNKAGSLQSDIVIVQVGGGVNYVDITFPAGSSTSTPINFTIACRSGEFVLKNYTCTDSGYVENYKCVGIAGTYKGECPVLKATCAALDLSAQSVANAATGQTCTELNSTSGTIICRCSLGKNPLQPGTGTVAAGLMFQFVGSDFSNTFKAAAALNNAGAASKAATIIVLFATLWGTTLISMFYQGWRQNKKEAHAMTKKQKKKALQIAPDPGASQEGGSRVNPWNKAKSVLQSSQLRSKEEERKEMTAEDVLQRVKAIFPAVFEYKSLLDGMMRELYNNHEYINFFWKLDQRHYPIVDILKMISIQSYLLFLLAVLYDLNYPDDDGSCEFHMTSSDCLSRKSVLDPSQTYCQWTASSASSGSCSYASPTFSTQITIYISAMTSFATCLYTVPLEYYLGMVAAPTLKASSDNAVLLGSFMTATTTATSPTSHSRQPLSVQNSISDLSIVPVGSTSISPPYSLSKSGFSSPRLLSMLKSSRSLTSEDRKRKQVGTSRLLKHRQAIFDGGHHERINTMLMRRERRRTVMINASITHGSPTSEVEDKDSFSHLMNELMAQSLLLEDDSETQSKFHQLWGLDTRSHTFLEPKTIWKTRSFLFLCRKQQKEVIDISRLVKEEVEGVAKSAEEMKEELERLSSEAERGFDILQMLVMDLLGRDSAAARIFAIKSELEHERVNATSWWTKMNVVVALLCIDGFLMYYAILKGFSKGLQWQSKYVLAWALQVVLDVFLFGTIHCLWFHFIMPRMVAKEVHSAEKLLRRTIRGIYEEGAEDRRNESKEKEEIVTRGGNAEQKTSHRRHRKTHSLEADASLRFACFNVAQHLHVSYRLAEQFPGLLESSIAKAYCSPFPGKTALKWSSAVDQWHDKPPEAAAAPSRWLLSSDDLRGKSIAQKILMAMGVIKVVLLSSSVCMPVEVQSIMIRMMEPLFLYIFTSFYLILLDHPVVFGVCLGCVVLLIIFLVWESYRHRRAVHAEREEMKVKLVPPAHGDPLAAPHSLPPIAEKGDGSSSSSSSFDGFSSESSLHLSHFGASDSENRERGSRKYSIASSVAGRVLQTLFSDRSSSALRSRAGSWQLSSLFSSWDESEGHRGSRGSSQKYVSTSAIFDNEDTFSRSASDNSGDEKSSLPSEDQQMSELLVDRHVNYIANGSNRGSGIVNSSSSSDSVISSSSYSSESDGSLSQFAVRFKANSLKPSSSRGPPDCIPGNSQSPSVEEQCGTDVVSGVMSTSRNVPMPSSTDDGDDLLARLCDAVDGTRGQSSFNDSSISCSDSHRSFSGDSMSSELTTIDLRSKLKIASRR
eukprot:scaffold2582_cov162-Ochromonas_danica.AAC.22